MAGVPLYCTSVATTLNNIAILYENLGDYTRAKSLHQRALAIQEKVYGSEHLDVATSLNNLAQLYQAQADYTRAEPLYQRALAIFEKVLGAEHPDMATSLNNLAILYLNQGDYARAEPLYQRALAIFENLLGREHPNVAFSLNNLAVFYATQGDYSRAEPLLQRALPIAIESGQPKLLWVVQNILSQLFVKQHSLRAAIFFGKQAVNTLQSLRANISKMAKSLQQSFIKDKAEVYQDLAVLLIEQGRLPEAQQVLAMLKEEEYFDFIRRDAQAGGKVRSTKATFNDFEQAWAQRYQAINQQLVALGRELRQLKQKALLGLTAAEKARRKQLRADMKVAKKAFIAYLEELRKAFEQASPARAIAFGEKNLGRLKPLQSTLRQLGEGVVLVHYLVTEDKLRIILTTPDVQLARDAEVGEKELNRTVFAFRDKLQHGPKKPLRGAKRLRTKRNNLRKTGTLDYAKVLYDWILKPIEADLAQAKATTLMLSLDGTLRYVPIAALFDGQP